MNSIKSVVPFLWMKYYRHIASLSIKCTDSWKSKAVQCLASKDCNLDERHSAWIKSHKDMAQDKPCRKKPWEENYLRMNRNILLNTDKQNRGHYIPTLRNLADCNPKSLFKYGIPISRHFSTTSISNGVNSSSQLLFPEFPSIHAAESIITYIHNTTDLSWWSTIILTAFLLRIVLIIPLTIYTVHNSEKLQRMHPRVIKVSKRLKIEVGMAMKEFGWSEAKARAEYTKNMNRLLRDMYIQENCHPLKSIASFWLQAPVWFSVSYSLRNMATRAVNENLAYHEECSSLTTGGLAWFEDLTQTDSLWILPVLMGSVTLFNIEMSRRNLQEVTRYRKGLTYVLRFVSLALIPISATMPSGMVVYWVSSGVFAAIQNLLLENKHLKKIIHLPVSGNESRNKSS